MQQKPQSTAGVLDVRPARAIIGGMACSLAATAVRTGLNDAEMQNGSVAREPLDDPRIR
jgi:hypothetical protein